MKRSKRTKITERRDTRMEVWRHNSFFGWARMMEVQARNVIAAPSVAPAAKSTAAQIETLARTLRIQLKERIKP